MPVIVYTSEDASAPVLSGTVSSLIALLTACLVTGYGSKAAAGWTKPYTGTDKAAFRMGGGNQRYLRVDDSVALSSTLVGYGAMTDVDTGTEPFPTAVQMASGEYFVKSSAASSASRRWVLVADNKFCILYGDTVTPVGTAYATNNNQILLFGDFFSNKVGDLYNTLLISNPTNVASGSIFSTLATSIAGALQAAHYAMRSYTGIGTSVQLAKHTDAAKMNGTVIGRSGSAYPDPVTGSILLAPLWVQETNIVRGRVPGIWCPLQDMAGVGIGDTFSGTGELAGKTFIILAPGPNSVASVARIAVETSDTWG